MDHKPNVKYESVARSNADRSPFGPINARGARRSRLTEYSDLSDGERQPQIPIGFLLLVPRGFRAKIPSPFD